MKGRVIREKRNNIQDYKNYEQPLLHSDDNYGKR